MTITATTSTIIQTSTTTITATTSTIIGTSTTTLVAPTTFTETVTTTALAPTTVTTTETTTLAPTTVTTTATTTLAPTTVTTTATATLAPTTVTTTATATLAPTTVTTTLPPATVTTTAVQVTTQAPATVTTTAVQPTTLPGSTVTAVETATLAPSTVTQLVATTVTAPPPGTAPASLVVDSTVQLTGAHTFELTGSISPKSDVAQIEFYADVNGRTRDLGAATLNKDGTFLFSDHVARGTQGFITAVATDSAGLTASAQAAFSLATGRPDAPTGPRQDRYDPVTGAYTGTTVFYEDGAPKTVTSVAADGTPLLTVHFRPDGSSVTEVEAPGQTVDASAEATFNNNGQPETAFVFKPGFGQDTINQFRANGPDHDTFALSSSDFSSVLDVLRHTAETPEGAVIHDALSGDSIKLAGIDKEVLVANTRDLKLQG